MLARELGVSELQVAVVVVLLRACGWLRLRDVSEYPGGRQYVLVPERWSGQRRPALCVLVRRERVVVQLDRLLSQGLDRQTAGFEPADPQFPGNLIGYCEGWLGLGRSGHGSSVQQYTKLPELPSLPSYVSRINDGLC